MASTANRSISFAPATAASRAFRLEVHETGWRWSRLDKWLAAGAITAFVVARLWHVPSFRLWFDEIFTLEAARRDWGGLFWFVRNYDVHPPLFYVLTKLWMVAGGQSFVWLGLFPALTAIATLVPLYLLARELKMRAEEFNLVVFLMALNGYLTGYAQEFRAYPWLMLLSACSLWLFVRYCNAHENRLKVLAPLAIVNLLLTYLHYYGWLVVGTQGLFLLAWNWRAAVPFAIASAAAVVAYLPWAYAVVHAAAHRVEVGDKALFFIPKPDLFSIAFFYGALNGLFELPHTTAASVLLFAFPVAAWLIATLRTGGRTNERFALLWLVLLAGLPVLVAFTVSRVLPTAIWGQRHLIIVAVPYYVLVACSVFRLPTRRWRRTALVVLAAWATLAGVFAQAAPYKVPAWDALVDHIVSLTPPGEPARVYAMDEDAAFPIQFYLERSGRPGIQAVVLQQDTARNRERFMADPANKPYWALTVPVQLITSLTDLGATRFWVCDDVEDASNIGYPGTTLRQVFTSAGYTVGDDLSVTLVNRRWNSRQVRVFSVSGSSARE